MIKLEHVTKYYNRGKRNEITVCNDLCLEFPNQGLVTILGSSGSGKTTLLNVISGMDKFDAGKVIFDGIHITKYNHKIWDKIRKEKIGYVYQDYNLLKELSVIDNLAPVLRMQGLTDDETLIKNVQYLLKSVDLENYDDRLIKHLSGGQQQRVGFARALANNPEVMLADEPTGNLDGKTTIELMNIIKEISKTRLVILVTHERALCDYYADRIIEIDYGKVIRDYKNTNSDELDYLQEHIINLKGYQKDEIKEESLSVNRYSNNAKFEPLNIDLIERNKTLYVKINSKDLQRTKYIDEDSEIIIRNNNENEALQESFNLERLFPKKETINKTNAFNIKTLLISSFKKVANLKKTSKMLYIAMFFLGIIISLSIGLLGEIFYVDMPYNELNRNYITVELDRSQYDSYQELETIDGVDQLMYINKPYTFSLKPPQYYQVNGSVDVKAQPIDIKFFDEATLIYGNLPETYEIIIDKSVANQMIIDYQYLGIKTYDDVLKCKFKIRTSGYESSIAADTGLYFNISGIAETKSKSVWMKEELLYSIVTPVLIDYRILGDNFQIVSGELPFSPLYLMINDQYKSVLLGNTPTNIGIITGHYNISGVYRYEVDSIGYNFEKTFISHLDYMRTKYFRINNYRNQDFSLLVYATDVEKAVLNLENAGYQVKTNIYKASFAQEIKLAENFTFYLIAIVGISISALCVYLTMRSNLISRTYEISVYRSIGVSRKEIRRIFLIESLITTTVSSILGFILTVLLIIQAQSTIISSTIARYNFLVVVLVIVGMYLINTLFSLIPVNILLKKTPSSIMKQSDL